MATLLERRNRLRHSRSHKCCWYKRRV